MYWYIVNIFVDIDGDLKARNLRAKACGVSEP